MVYELGIYIPHREATISEPSGQWGRLPGKLTEHRFNLKKFQDYADSRRLTGIKVHGFASVTIERLLIKNFRFKVLHVIRPIKHSRESLLGKRIRESKNGEITPDQLRLVGCRVALSNNRTRNFVNLCHSHKIGVLPVEFKNVISNPLATATEIADFLGIKDPQKSEAAAAKVNPAFVTVRS
jgi:hypothetical protein